MSAQAASQALQALDAPDASPWLAFGGIAAPYAGLFEATGAASVLGTRMRLRWVRRLACCPRTSFLRFG